ncbi:Multidrug resistance protein 3 [Lactobacillus helveticus]|nr:Multidrug resistance protein 3 [Lactobacillus helveticus]
MIASWNGAAILGPLVGGWLIDAFSWHWVFYINIPIGLIALIICLIYYKPVTSEKTPVFDIPGAGLLVIGLLLFLMCVQLVGLTANWIVISLIIISLVFIVLFFIRENHAANPIIPVSLFKNKDLDGDFLLFAFTWGAFIAVNTYMPMWAQALLGLSALLGGMTLIPNSIVEIIASQSVAAIQEHMSTFKLALIGIIAMMISSAGLFLADIHTPVQMLTFIGAFSGIGVGFIFVAMQLKVQLDAGLKNMATATSTSYLIRILAQTVMAAVYGVIMNLNLASGVHTYKGITMAMMNKLSDAKSAKLLPQELVPTMRTIFHAGIKEIMLVSLILLIIAFVLNFYFNFGKKRKKLQ